MIIYSHSKKKLVKIYMKNDYRKQGGDINEKFRNDKR